MGRDCSKASGNVYFEARKAAAEYDDRLYSREKAAELLGVSVSTLADYENGNTKFVPVDKVVLMADAVLLDLFNALSLEQRRELCRNYYPKFDDVMGVWLA